MKIAVIGFGKMGKEIIKAAEKRGIEITATIDNESDWDKPAPLGGADVAMEFSTPATAVGNMKRCFAAGVPVVCGTTGWYEQLAGVTEECMATGGCLLYGTNFSKGVNVLFALSEWLGAFMDAHTEYDVSIAEYHHAHKLDAPSGTAIRLAEKLLGVMTRKKEWVKGDAGEPEQIGIRSVRNGEIPGTHQLVWSSPDDGLQIIHTVKDRRVFAEGALDAAEWVCGKKGVFTYEETLFGRK